MNYEPLTIPALIIKPLFWLMDVLFKEKLLDR